ncbi:MAG: hypothetical protein IJ161_08095 [Bacteroidales bacterium]|nr:hypothetical protein [Bacteroidales bacterium]
MNGRITPDSKYVIGKEITCYEVDGEQRLTPAAFMDIAQEMAYLAADAMHFGYDELQAEGKAWVLSRLQFRFVDVPKWRESVEVATWHKGPYGPFYLRDFAISSLEGERKINGTSSWVILDVASRRMCRTTEVVEMIPESTICPDAAIADPAPKVQMPRGVEPTMVGSHTVSYSDVDILGHTNNAKYVVWGMDCIDYAVTSGKTMKELSINFNHETKPGQTVDLYMYSEQATDGTAYYVEGKVEGSQAFCMKVVF